MHTWDVGINVTETTAKSPILIDVWADIVCPWCYVGEARLLKAVESTGTSAEIRVHAYELNPDHGEPEKMMDMLARRLGSAAQAKQMDDRIAELAHAEGLPYTSDRVSAKSFDAHRLIAAGSAQGRGLEVREAIQRGHFDGSLDLSNHEHLADAAASAGLDRTAALAVLASDQHADDVRADQAQARELGVTGVPFTVIGERLAIPGAVDTSQYAEVIERIAAE